MYLVDFQNKRENSQCHNEKGFGCPVGEDEIDAEEKFYSDNSHEMTINKHKERLHTFSNQKWGIIDNTLLP